MKIHTFTASTANEAVAQIREQLGPEAVVPASCRQSHVSEGGALRRPDFQFPLAYLSGNYFWQSLYAVGSWGAHAPSRVVIDAPVDDALVSPLQHGFRAP